MEWSPRTGESAVPAVAGVLLGLAAAFLDPLGRVLVGAAAVLLLALAARDRLLRPRLAARPAVRVAPRGVDVTPVSRAVEPSVASCTGASSLVAGTWRCVG